MTIELSSKLDKNSASDRVHLAYITLFHGSALRVIGRAGATSAMSAAGANKSVQRALATWSGFQGLSTR
jgi:hypothetical protein